MTALPSSDARHRAALQQQFGRSSNARRDGVHVQCGDFAASLCQAAGAVAVTAGEQIFIHPGLSAAPAAVWRAVLAHEVIHVLQNRRAASVGRAARRLRSADDDLAEREARSLGPQLARGQVRARDGRAQRMAAVRDDGQPQDSDEAHRSTTRWPSRSANPTLA
jgi:hypothetical protein